MLVKSMFLYKEVSFVFVTVALHVFPSHGPLMVIIKGHDAPFMWIGQSGSGFDPARDQK